MIKSVKLKQEEEYLEIILEKGEVYSYPWVWLRNSCQCSSCIYGPSQSRRGDVKDIVIDISVENAEVADDGQTVKMKWSDGHESVFQLSWLLHFRLTEDGIEERRNAYRLPAKPWGSEMANNITEIEFSKLLEDDHSLYKWLKTLEVHGIVMLRNTPTKAKTSLVQIAERVNAWLRPQHHGANFAEKEIWSVRTDMKQHSVAYTQDKLGFHTDMTYYDNPPSMMMLHCLAQTNSKGGESLFADGFKAANLMKELNPDYYRILTTCPLYHQDIGSYYYKFQSVGLGPTIRLDDRGELKAVAFENFARHWPVETKLEDIKTFYKAYKMFGQLLEDNCIEFKMRPGDMACIDNKRVLHGRQGFDLQPGDVRHLEGSYIEWDELRSVRRVLDEKFKNQ